MSRFVDPLDPLLEKTRWELDQLAAERAAARRHLEQCDRDEAEVSAQLVQLWQAFAQLREEGGTLDLAREAGLRRYAERLQASLLVKQAARDQASALHERIGENLRGTLQALQGLERRRKQQETLHDDEARRQDAKDVDDRWLMSDTVREGRA